MKIFLKKLFSSREELTAEVIQTWTVSWYSRYGDYSGNESKEFEVFTRKEDAEKFKNSLKEAHKLLRNTNKIYIALTKNK